MNGADEILGPALGRGQAGDAALLFEDEVITYGALDAAVARAGGALRAWGVERQDRVLLLVHDRPEFFYAFLGAMKIGAVPIALTLRCAAAELLYVIQDSGCRAIILDVEFLPLYLQVEASLEAPPTVILVDADPEGMLSLRQGMAGQSSDLASTVLDPGEMAFWMYTSGTTGSPKGAIHGADAIPASQRFLESTLKVGRGDRLFCSSKLFFAFSMGHILMGALRLGATSILFRDWPSAEAVAGVVERYRPTVMLSVPTLFAALLRDGWAAKEAFRRVAHYVAAGERLPASVFAGWREASGRPIIEGIGATEAMMMFMANLVDEQRAGSCGLPVPATEVKLLDEAGAPVVEPGMPGIGWVKSSSVAKGYWNQPEKTAQAFRDGWYRTGDVFTRDADGWYFHVGRSDDMLKVSGQWVSPAEIEEVARLHADVEDAAVIGLPNSDGFDRLTLCLISKISAERRAALEAELGELLRSRLSIYKCPRRFLFQDDFPRTATGKLQRFRLREIAAAD